MFEEVKILDLVITVSFVMPILLASLLLWFFINYHKKKFELENERKDRELKQKEMIISQQEAVQQERNRIASEMHDDLGSGLTVMKYLCESMVRKTDDQTLVSDIRKLSTYNTALVSNMSEIIWAMNSRYDDMENLITYLRRYSSEFLESNNLPFEFVIDPDIGHINVSGEKRRNILLIHKEILNNAVKYSKANKINVRIDADDRIKLHYAELGGIGFDPEDHNLGNGLYNMKRRIEQIDGNIQYLKDQKGMHTFLEVPLDNTNMN